MGERCQYDHLLASVQNLFWQQRRAAQKLSKQWLWHCSSCGVMAARQSRKQTRLHRIPRSTATFIFSRFSMSKMSVWEYSPGDTSSLIAPSMNFSIINYTQLSRSGNTEKRRGREEWRRGKERQGRAKAEGWGQLQFCFFRVFVSKYLMTSQVIRAAIGKVAPHFKAQAWLSSSNEFKELSLENYKSKWLLLFFYPLDFTFVCPTEIVDFSNKAKHFREHGCEVVGCSIDSHFVHRRWTLDSRAEGGLGPIDIPLLADVKKDIADKYGVLNDAGLALRGTFLIDDNQIVRHISVNDLSVGRNVDEYLRLLQGFQYTAKHGEVCPAGWQKGAPTMKPKLDSQELKGYWQNVHSKK